MNITSIYIRYLHLFFLFLLFSCATKESKDPKDPKDQDSTISNDGSRITNPTKTIFYQLHSINGFFAPAGSTYEYDAGSKLWCERPTAGELMAYSQDAGINDPSEIPDLSNYFERKTTDLLNSCLLTVTQSSDYNAINLSVGSLFIYVDTIPKGLKSFQIQELRRPLFNFPINGDMILDNGRNFQMSLGNTPKITYINDYGNYELHFEEIRKQKFAKVKAEKAYFHQSNNANTKQKMFVLKNQNVLVKEINNDFALVSITNARGQIISGWLLKAELEIPN